VNFGEAELRGARDQAELGHEERRQTGDHKNGRGSLELMTFTSKVIPALAARCAVYFQVAN
jgi:hypothetical protein